MRISMWSASWGPDRCVDCGSARLIIGEEGRCARCERVVREQARRRGDLPPDEWPDGWVE